MICKPIALRKAAPLRQSFPPALLTQTCSYFNEMPWVALAYEQRELKVVLIMMITMMMMMIFKCH